MGEESPLFQQELLHSKKKLQEDPQDDHDSIIRWIKDMEQRRGGQEDEDDKEEVSVWASCSGNCLARALSAVYESPPKLRIEMKSN